MKNIVSVITFLISLVQVMYLHAQVKSEAAKVIYGQHFKRSSGYFYANSFDDQESDGMFIYNYSTRKGKEEFIEYFDENLNPAEKKAIRIFFKGNILEIERIIYFQNQFLAFSSFVDRKNNQVYLIKQTIDSESLRLEGEPEIIYQSEYEWKRYSAGFNFSLSPDKSKLVLYYYLPKKSKNPTHSTYNLTVFNDDMSVLWEKTITKEKNLNTISFKQMMVDNHGNVFLLGVKTKIYEKNELYPNSKKTTEDQYEVIGLFDIGKHQKVFELDLGDRFITDVEFKLSSNNKLVGAGFYQDITPIKKEARYGVAHGCFYIKLDPETKKVEKSSFKKFDRDLFMRSLTEKEKKRVKKKEEKNKKEEPKLSLFYVDDIIIKEDGGMIMIGEQFKYWVTTYHYTDGNGNTQTRHTDHYFYGDIVVVDYSSEGTINWNVVIPKHQHTTNDRGHQSGYISSYKNGKLFMVFNDHFKNVVNKDGGSYNQWLPADNVESQEMINFSLSKKGGVVSVVTIDKEGSHNRKILYSLIENPYTLVPSRARLSKDKDILVLTYFKKKFRFSKIKFEDRQN